MEEKRTLYVGLDLCDDITQLTCFSEVIFEPESIGQYEDGSTDIITVLGIKESTGEWLIGEDAIQCYEEGEGILIEHIIEQIMEQTSFQLYDIEFSCVQILEKYLRKILRLLKPSYPDNSICKLTVTIQDMDVYLIKTIYEALKNLGIEKDRVQVISHQQSYLYYALSQKKELWMNDIAMFELNERGLWYHQISINRRNMPMLVGVHSQDYSDTLSYSIVLEQPDTVGYIFENIAKGILHKEIITTVYLTGKGFDGKWVNHVLKELCVGRRLFIGQNLYCRGACYASKEQAAKENPDLKEKLSQFLFLSDEMINCNISTRVYYNAKMTEILLAKAGMSWYDVDCQMDLIPDEEEELEIVVKDVIKRTATPYILNLEKISGRMNRGTRLGFWLRLIDQNTCVITVKDKGFGDVYPTTNRIWEKTISLKQESEKVT